MDNAAKVGEVAGKIVLALVMALVLAASLNGVTFAFLVMSGAVDEAELVNPSAIGSVMTVFTIIQSIAFIAATVIVYAIFERRQRWRLGWRRSGRVAELMRGMLIGILLISFVFIIVGLLGGLKIAAVRWNATLARGVFQSVLLFAFVAVSEELFSRGYVQGLVKHRFGTAPALIVSSLLFAILHAFNPGVFSSYVPGVNLILAGGLLGLSREVSGSLWMPIGFHLTWNLFQGSVFGFPVSGMEVESIVVLDVTGSPLVTGGRFGAEGSLVATAALVAGLFLIHRLYRPRRSGEA